MQMLFSPEGGGYAELQYYELGVRQLHQISFNVPCWRTTVVQ
jgi:hypothetical protein